MLGSALERLPVTSPAGSVDLVCQVPERLALANGLSDEEGCGPPTVRWPTPLLPKGLALGWALLGARGCDGGAEDGGAAAAAAAAVAEEEE